MDFYCEVCLKHIKTKNKYKYFKSNSHQEFNKSKHINLTSRNLDINKLDNIIFECNIEYNKKYFYCLINYDFNLDFNDYGAVLHLRCDFCNKKNFLGRIVWKN